MTILEEKKENICKCVGKHVPLPHYLMKVSIGLDTVYLCPTSYHNFMCLEKEYLRTGGRPAGNIRKHFSDYIQTLVQLKYDYKQNS